MTVTLAINDREITVDEGISLWEAARLAGFEHSVANMYFIPLGLWLAGGTIDGLSWPAFLLNNLVPVTIGNIIGGAVLVGVVYWFVYLRTAPE